MKRVFAFAAVVCCAPVSWSALAADVSSVSKIDAVTVYLSGAEVTRVAKTTLDKGEHTVVFSDVPAGAVPGSIRVEGKATGKLAIGSVDTARKLLQRAESQAADVERKKLEDQLEQLRDARAVVEAQAQAAETQKALVANLAQLPTRPAPAQASGAGEDWSKVLAIIAAGSADASRMALDAQVKLREFDRKIDDIERQLVALAPPRTEQTEVRVNVSAESALEADFTIRYQVPNAHWSPLYDARLATGTKTAPPTLDLARRAAITQKSGESWSNVQLVLSTARPSDSAAVPALLPQTIDFAVPVPAMPAPAPMTRNMMREKADRTVGQVAEAQDAAAASGDEAAPEPASAPVVEQVAQLTSAPFEASFAVPGRVSVPGTGEAKRVLLMAEQLETTLSSRTVPKLDTNAYLYAKLRLLKGTPLLPGQVSLFRDGTFVGTGNLPLLPPGEDHDLGFGVDDQVKVRHAVLEEKRGESGLISTSNVETRNYRVTLKNLHERAIDVTVIDRLPVSLHQDIKVEPTGKAQPAKKDVDGERGINHFENRLEPDEEVALDYGYRLSWPAAKSITYGP